MTSTDLAGSHQLHVAGNGPPPALPPRSLLPSEDPPPYSVMAMSSQDPRSSSTQSLVPDPALDDTGRRRLLMVYIHGFMGNETSFRSFPAHVHNLVTVTLAESHVVHTKLYPRYLSKHALEVARDNFSRWLAPHEDEWTDVILLGHSMGGLLAADVALAFRHRIIGIINFDVPFLGMHPGIVMAGLGSIFSPSPAPQDVLVPDSEPGKRPSRMSTLFNPKPSDPNYNPSFANDVQLPVRKGWENTLHWMSKHYKDGLREATKGLVKSHLEFGGAMADYRELKDRYAKVRALEIDDANKRNSSFPGSSSVPRVRFINYYTASTGKPKKPKSPRSPSPSRPASWQLQHHDSDKSSRPTTSQHVSQDLLHQESERSASVTSSLPEMTHIHPEPISDTPRISIEVQEHRGGSLVPVSPQEPLSATSPVDKLQRAPTLPEIPPIPKEPPFIDLMAFSDKAERKAAEKEHDHALKEYQKAVKVRNKTIHQRDQLMEKWEKEKEKERQKAQKEEEKKQAQKEEERQKAQKEEETKRKKPALTHHEAEMQRLAAEAKRMEAEAARMRGEPPEREQTSPPKRQERPDTPPASYSLEDDVETMQLGDQHHSTHQPYTNYDFSRSTIMAQAPPSDNASLTDSGYTLSTQTSHTASSQHTHDLSTDHHSSSPPKKKKLKKFCMLPPKDAAGIKDPTWVPVRMDGMDEVTAHTSLFFVNDTYERLVGEVGARIEEWVREADSERLVREMGEK